MGRTPTRNKHLPQGMRARWRGAVVYYYFDSGATPRREVPLGKDYTEAVRKWAELRERSSTGDLVTFKHVADRYTAEVLPKKAPATQEINLRELRNLLLVFNAVPIPIDDIEPVDVRRYLDYRRDAPVAANREKALLSHIYNFARSKGLTGKPNPCAGIKGNKETGRDAYIEDDVYAAIWDVAEPLLRDAMDVAYLTGQRPADVRKMTRADVRDGSVNVKQNKTGAKLRVEVIGQFASVMDRIAARKVAGLTLITNKHGQPLTKSTLRGAINRARLMAAEASRIGAQCAGLPDMSADILAFQFRDLRAKAGTDTEQLRGMAAAKDQLGHTSEGMTANYVRHRLGKLVKPTK
jgi:integrase